MVDTDLSSEPFDPLGSHSLLALLPRTVKPSSTVVSTSNDLKSIHDFMKSEGFRHADTLLEKAKAIVDGGCEFLNSNLQSFAASLGGDELNALNNEKHQERRPGLGCKRPRFSFKPNSSQTTSSILPTLNVDRLHDPEEFFIAFERRENAKKEIERQRGVSLIGVNEFNSSQNERKRRPGLLGKEKKFVSYKHCYSLETFQNDTSLCSQENLKHDVSSTADCDMNPETINPTDEFKKMESAEHAAPSENKVNTLLDELLSYDSEDLDGERAMSILQKRLQIKSFDLSKRSLPNFNDIESTDFVNMGKGVAKHLDQGGLVKELSVSKSTAENMISKEDLSKGFLDVSNKLKSLLEDGICKRTAANSGSEEVMPGDSNHLLDKSAIDFSPKSVGRDAGQPEIIAYQEDCMDGKSTSHHAEELQHYIVSSALVDCNSGGTRLETLSSKDHQLDDTNTVPGEDLVSVATNTTPEFDSEQQTEGCEKPSHGQGKENKAPRTSRLQKEYSRRKSLIGAGTSWNNGVRRSTRNKIRPLEYWKGERLLYGRVHGSLATVIGVKYMSPAKDDEKPIFKVKSYVSGQHKELVEMAALH